MARLLQKSPESDLIRSAQQGQREAFDLLYSQYHQAVLHFLFNRLQNWQDAEDIVQEVFLRAWLNIRKYQDQGIPFSHYLFRIAHNAVVDFHRRNNRMVYVEDVDFNPESIEQDELSSLQLDMQNLETFLQKLPQDYRKVLMLRFLTGFTPEETARIINRTEIATRILQHRAIHAVRELVRKDNDKDC